MFFIYTSWQIVVSVFIWRANVKFEATIVLDSSMSSSLIWITVVMGDVIYFSFFFLSIYILEFGKKNLAGWTPDF